MGSFLADNKKLCSQTRSDSLARVIGIDNLFKNYAVLFDCSYDPGIIINDLRGRFTPTEDDIVLAENIFTAQYNETNQATESVKGAPVLGNVKLFFWKYNRQYVGYIDNNGDKNLIMQLFDYSRKRRVENIIGDSWKRRFVIYFAEKKRFISVVYRVNLKQQKLYGTF